ncbi:zinc knuckle CX2CX4HX4C containing protein [Tanacetum coccineum]
MEKLSDGESLLRGVANSMNKSSGKGGAATSYQCMPTRVLNPSSGNNVSHVQVEYEGLNIDESAGYTSATASHGEFTQPIASTMNPSSFGDLNNPNSDGSSPLVSRATIINMPPRGPNDIDVAATFGVPLITVGDMSNLINDIETGKHDELLFGMTNDDRMETMDALGIICKSIQADNTNTNVTPYKVSHVDPTDQSVDVPKSTSYVEAASAHSKDQPEVNSNFCPLVAEPVFEGVNISIPRKMVEKVSTRFEHTLYGYFIGKRIAFLVVEYYAKSNWAKHRLKRIMMNSKGFFFFKFDTQIGLEAVLEGGPWLIRKSPIILKKWSMDTRLLKEELTRIPVWVKLHDVPIQVFEEDGISLIATFIGKPVMLDSYTSSMCKDSWGRSSFARCDLCKIFGHDHDHCPKKVVTPPIVVTSNVVTPNIEKTNDGFQTVGKKKKKKGKSKSNNGGQFVGPSVKQNVRYEPKATTSAPKKGASNVGNASNSSSLLKNIGTSSNQDNITSSNSFSALNVEDDEDEEHVENVYDEMTNLFNTKTSECSSFTAAVG